MTSDRESTRMSRENRHARESSELTRKRNSSEKAGFACIRMIRGPLVTFSLNENGLARVWLFEAVSMDGCGDAKLRHPDYADGDRFS